MHYTEKWRGYELGLSLNEKNNRATKLDLANEGSIDEVAFDRGQNEALVNKCL